MRGSLGELAALPGMPSEPTLRKMIAENEDFPIISRGSNGVAYEFDLTQAALFIRGLREKEEAAARARADEVRQFGLELLGADAASTSSGSVGLSPAERKAMLEEELIAIKVAERRGELVRKSSVELAVSTALVKLQQQGKSFSARLAKRADVPRPVLVVIDQMIEADQIAFADMLARMTDDDDAAPEDGANPPV